VRLVVLRGDGALAVQEVLGLVGLQADGARFPIIVRQCEGAEVRLLQAKADGATSANVAFLLGASWSSSTSYTLHFLG
jgi:hypothetical protein